MQDSSTPYETPDWLSSSPPPQPTPRNRRPIFIVIILLSLAVLAVTTMLVIHLLGTPGCLSKDDYKELSGLTYDGDLQPESSFYTTTLSFEKDQVLDDSSMSQVTALTDFYKKHQGKSIRITIGSSFSLPDDKATAQENVLAIQQKLVQSGLPAALIVLDQPLYVVAEDGGIVAPSYTISLTSVEGCR